MPKIGWLEVRPDDSRTSFELFKREFRALGYVDGRSVVFEYRNAGNNLDRLPTLADELVRLGVNLVFAVQQTQVRKSLCFIAFSAMLFALGSTSHAQQPAKIFRVAFLDTSSAFRSARLLEVFRQELGQLGWVEGKNVTIEHRFAEGKSESMVEIAAELVRLKVDVILVTK